jgi:ABC-type Fe3+ transport system substrate-binding protein
MNALCSGICRILPGLAAALLAVVATPTLAATQAEIAKLQGPDRQKILEEGARKEGKVTFYGSLSADTGVMPLFAGFNKKYPYIKTGYWIGAAREMLQKVSVEKRGHALVADVLQGGGVAVPAIKGGFSAPFTSPALADHPKESYDAGGNYAAVYLAHYTLLYNTKTVPAAEVPKSYDDLLDPKWKGKMIWRTGTDTGAPLFIANLLVDRGDAKGEEYVQKLAKQQPANFTQSARTMVDMVGRSEYPLALNVAVDLSIDLIEKGAPAAMQPLDPSPVTTMTIQLADGAPNPHAAMLLIDYILGPEGQDILAKAGFFVPNTKVTQMKAMEDALPRKRGVREKVLAPEEFFDKAEKAEGLFQKYFQ